MAANGWIRDNVFAGGFFTGKAQFCDNVTNLDDLVEKTTDQSVETRIGAILVLRHIQDGGEAGGKTIDKRRDAFWVTGQPSQRLERLGAFSRRQLV